MKKISTLISTLLIGASSFSQVIFQSDLSSWSAGDPTDWMGVKTNIGSANVIEVPTASTYGGSDAQLTNATTSHKRFTTQPLSVTSGQSYEIKFWVKGQGEIRTGLFDNHTPTTTSGYIYNSYITVNSATPVEYTQTITALNTNAAAEFILSVVNTVGPAHLIVDSVSIAETVIPPATFVSIYDIQYTTDPSGDSPEAGNEVQTYGIVTGVFAFGADAGRFFIQDGDGPWNGIYVYDNTHTLALGDSVSVTGTVSEYFGLTEIGTVSNVTIISSGNPQPNATVVSTLNAAQEQYESVLVQVVDAECTNADAGFGQFIVNDGSGDRLVDDQIYSYTATLGSYYDITGVTFLSFGEVKLFPRIAPDIVVKEVAGIEESSTFSMFPNPSTGMVAINVNPGDIIRVYNMNGSLVYQGIGEKLIDLTELEAGIYQVMVTQNETTTTQKLVIK